MERRRRSVMPVLAMALAAVVIFVIMVALAVVHLLEWRQLQKIKAQPAGRPFRVLTIEQVFEPEHAILWDTQIPALQLINSAGGKGLPIQRLYGGYLEAA